VQALETSPQPQKRAAAAVTGTGVDLIAAIQRSPYRELEIEPERYHLPVRDLVF
jgi:hypothetical protein